MQCCWCCRASGSRMWRSGCMWRSRSHETGRGGRPSSRPTWPLRAPARMPARRCAPRKMLRWFVLPTCDRCGTQHGAAHCCLSEGKAGGGDIRLLYLTQYPSDDRWPRNALISNLAADGLNYADNMAVVHSYRGITLSGALAG